MASHNNTGNSPTIMTTFAVSGCGVTVLDPYLFGGATKLMSKFNSILDQFPGNKIYTFGSGLWDPGTAKYRLILAVVTRQNYRQNQNLVESTFNDRHHHKLSDVDLAWKTLPSNDDKYKNRIIYLSASKPQQQEYIFAKLHQQMKEKDSLTYGRIVPEFASEDVLKVVYIVADDNQCSSQTIRGVLQSITYGNTFCNGHLKSLKPHYFMLERSKEPIPVNIDVAQQRAIQAGKFNLFVPSPSPKKPSIPKPPKIENRSFEGCKIQHISSFGCTDFRTIGSRFVNLPAALNVIKQHHHHLYQEDAPKLHLFGSYMDSNNQRYPTLDVIFCKCDVNYDVNLSCNLIECDNNGNSQQKILHNMTKDIVKWKQYYTTDDEPYDDFYYLDINCYKFRDFLQQSKTRQARYNNLFLTLNIDRTNSSILSVIRIIGKGESTNNELSPPDVIDKVLDEPANQLYKIDYFMQDKCDVLHPKTTRPPDAAKQVSTTKDTTSESVQCRVQDKGDVLHPNTTRPPDATKQVSTTKDTNSESGQRGTPSIVNDAASAERHMVDQMSRKGYSGDHAATVDSSSDAIDSPVSDSHLDSNLQEEDDNNFPMQDGDVDDNPLDTDTMEGQEDDVDDSPLDADAMEGQSDNVDEHSRKRKRNKGFYYALRSRGPASGHHLRPRNSKKRAICSAGRSAQNVLSLQEKEGGARYVPPTNSLGFLNSSTNQPIKKKDNCVPYALWVLISAITKQQWRLKEDFQDKLSPNGEHVSYEMFKPFLKSMGFQATFYKHRLAQCKAHVINIRDKNILIMLDNIDGSNHALAFFDGKLIDNTEGSLPLQIEARDRIVLNRLYSGDKKEIAEAKNLGRDIFKKRLDGDWSSISAVYFIEKLSLDAQTTTKDESILNATNPSAVSDDANQDEKENRTDSDQGEKEKQEARRARNRARRKRQKERKRAALLDATNQH